MKRVEFDHDDSSLCRKEDESCREVALESEAEKDISSLFKLRSESEEDNTMWRESEGL